MTSPLRCSEVEAYAILAQASDIAGFVRQVKPVVWFCVGSIAVAGLREDRGCVTLCSAWVAPTHRGRGIGMALIDALIEEARRRGYTWARTWAFRPGAFERIGWTRGRMTSVGAWYLRGNL